jgi:hypothetical protein
MEGGLCAAPPAGMPAVRDAARRQPRGDGCGDATCAVGVLGMGSGWDVGRRRSGLTSTRIGWSGREVVTCVSRCACDCWKHVAYAACLSLFHYVLYVLSCIVASIRTCTRILRSQVIDLLGIRRFCQGSWPCAIVRMHDTCALQSAHRSFGWPCARRFGGITTGAASRAHLRAAPRAAARGRRRARG